MSREGGPALQLLAAALRLWIRQECEALEGLDLQLQGSALQLLRGHLDGVRLEARGVRYQGLELEQVSLTSAPIEVQLGNLLRGQPLQLDHPFAIQGLVSFTPEGLRHSLSQDAWRPLGDSLAETLLGLTPLLHLGIREERLVLAAQPMGAASPVEVEALLSAEQGSIALRTDDPRVGMVLPMDPAIRISRAAVEQGLVVLEGEALVTP